MSVLKNLNIRPLRQRDINQLEAWRLAYEDGTLTLPNGYGAAGVETAIAEKDGRIIGSLTATNAVIIDPFIHDPAANGLDVYAAVYNLDRALCYTAQKTGAVAAFTSVPVELTRYHEILAKSGYEPTAELCRVFRRSLSSQG